jgi:hypothetical protein
MPLLPRRSPKAISPSDAQDDLTLPVILEFQSPTSAVLAARHRAPHEVSRGS